MSEAPKLKTITLDEAQSATVQALCAVLAMSERLGVTPQVMSSMLVGLAADVVRAAVQPCYFETALEQIIAAMRAHAESGETLIPTEGEP
jgi:hypothetical protein